MIRRFFTNSFGPPSIPALFLMAGLLFLGFSCSTQRHRKAASIVNYVNQDILALAPIESQALARYAEVTGENFKGEDEVYHALESDVIPTYTRFLRNLREVPIQDPEVGRLHSLYVRSASLLLDGFKTKRLALEKDDPQLMATANAKIEQGRQQGEQWRAGLLQLCQKYGIKEEK